MVISYEVDPGGKFKQAITDALNQVNDLTIPFNLIAKNWYKSNSAIFALKGPGKYPPLGGMNPNAIAIKGTTQTRRQRAEARKEKKYGFAYPLLKATGALEDSLTQPGNEHAVKWIINGKTLLLGTNLDYAIYHQSDEARTKLPFRPFLFIGSEQTAPAEIQNNRQTAWINIVGEYVKQVVAQVGE